MSDERRFKIDSLEEKGNWKKAAKLWYEQAEESSDETAKILAYLKAGEDYSKVMEASVVNLAANSFICAFNVVKESNDEVQKTNVISIGIKTLESLLENNAINWQKDEAIKAKIHDQLVTLTTGFDETKRVEHSRKAALSYLHLYKPMILDYKKDKLGNKEQAALDNIHRAISLLIDLKEMKDVHETLIILLLNSVDRFDGNSFVQSFKLTEKWFSAVENSESQKIMQNLSLKILNQFLEPSRIDLSSIENPDEVKSKQKIIKNSLKDSSLKATSAITVPLITWVNSVFKTTNDKSLKEEISDITTEMALYSAKNRLPCTSECVQKASYFFEELGEELKAAEMLKGLSENFLQTNRIKAGKNFAEIATRLFIKLNKKETALRIFLSTAEVVGNNEDYTSSIKYLKQAESLSTDPEIKNEIEAMITNFLYLYINKRDFAAVKDLVNTSLEIFSNRGQESKIPPFLLENAKRLSEEDMDKKVEYLKMSFNESTRLMKDFTIEIFNFIDENFEFLMQDKNRVKYCVPLLLTYVDLKEQENNIEEAYNNIYTKIPKILSNKGIKEVMELKEKLEEKALALDKLLIAGKLIEVVGNNLISINRKEIALPTLQKSFDIFMSANLIDQAKSVLTSWQNVINQMRTEKKQKELKNEFFNKLIESTEKINWVSKKSEILFEEGKHFVMARKIPEGISFIDKSIEILPESDVEKAKEIAHFCNEWGKSLIDHKDKDREFGFKLMNNASETLKKVNVYRDSAKLSADQSRSLAKRKEINLSLEYLDKAVMISLENQDGLLAGELVESVADDFTKYFSDDSSVELYKKAGRLYKDANGINEGQILAKRVEDLAMGFAKDKKRKKFYKTYFDAAVKLYEEFAQVEKLGDLYVKELHRIFNKGKTDDIIKIARKASDSYASSKGTKTNEIVETLSRCTRALVKSREYVKAGVLIEESKDMLIKSKQRDEAKKFLKNESIYLIENKAIDVGIGLLDNAVNLYYKDNDKISAGIALFQGAKVLTTQDQYVQAIANISRSVAYLEEDDKEDAKKEIRIIANDCVSIANRLIVEGNDYAAKLYMDKSKEIYESGIVTIDDTSSQVFDNYTDNLLDKMNKSVRTTVKRRRKKKRDN